MTTTLNGTATSKNEKIRKLKAALERLSNAVQDSVSEFFITIFTWGVLNVFIIQLVPAQPAATLIASTMMIYIILLLIQIVHKFDNHWTVDELAEAHQFDMHEIKETLDRIERNDVP